MADDIVQELHDWGGVVDPTLWGLVIESVAEIERLRRWKAEAIEVLNRWDAVADMVPVRPGDRKSDAVAAEIAKQKKEIIRLESLYWSARRGVRRE